MPKLILIKHAHSQMTPGLPPEQWELSEQGRERSNALAARLATHVPDLIFSSEERKAAQTAERLASKLDRPWQASPGLQEHDRGNVPVMATKDFISAMAQVFRRPQERVLGRETADQALTRFERALSGLLDQHAGEDVAIVTHGTVIALFAAEHADVDPFLNWRRMGLPSFMVFERPAMTLVETVASVE
jgi:broad specificity phosphatase PhoE